LSYRSVIVTAAFETERPLVHCG